MAKISPIDITGRIVEMLGPLGSEDRLRVISASLALLGETMPATSMSAGGVQGPIETHTFPPRAQIWMKQHSLSTEQLLQVFHLAEGQAEIIATSPGKDTKERTLNGYVLAGVAALLVSGEPSFTDKTARAFCKSSGCYDANNHATYLKGKGNEFTGTKDKGWMLTAPGLKHAAALVQGLSK